MCKVPSLGDISGAVGDVLGGGLKSLGLPTSMNDLTGETIRRRMAEQARAQAAQFEAEQRRAETERRNADEAARQRLAGIAERRTVGRASTLLTGPRGLVGGAGASRTLLPGG